MFNSNTPEEQPDRSFQPQDLRPPRRPSPIEPPAVKRLCDRILERGDSLISSALHEARSQGPLSEEQFTSLARTCSDLRSLKQLAAALESMVNDGVDKHFALCMPTLAHVTKGLVTFTGDNPGEAKMAAHRLTSLVLGIMNARDDFHSTLISGLDETAAADLAHAVNEGDPTDKAYWSCLELQTVSRPTMENLQRMFDAHACVRDNLPEESLPSEALLRVVRTLGEREFAPVFNLVVAEYRSCSQKPIKMAYDLDMMEYAVSGLAYAALPHIDEFIGIFKGAEGDEFNVATRVTLAIAKGLDHDPEDEAIIALRDAVFDIIDDLDTQAAHTAAPRAALAHQALASLAATPDDVALVQSFADRALESEPSAALIGLLEELAEAYEDVFNNEALEPLEPVPPPSDVDTVRPAIEERCAQSSSHVHSLSGAGLNAYLASMAAELAELRNPREVKQYASDIAATVLASEITSRDPDEGSVFVKFSEARAFAKRYYYMCLGSLPTAAAALLPEALGILRGSEEQDIKASRITAKTYENLCKALTHLAVSINEREELRRIALSRLSESDWSLLRSLHESEQHDFWSASDYAALAGLSLRAALEADESWHEDLIKTVSGENVVGGLFVTPCLIGEYRRRDSSWDLIAKVNLRTDDDEVMWPCAAGASLRLPDGYQRIFSLLSASASDDIAKGFLLVQSLRFDLSEEQLAECRRLVSLYLDEPGQLGVDALVTYGCVADEADCAREINKLHKPAGTEAAFFYATRSLAAARALRNLIVPADVREQEGRSRFWQRDSY